MLCPPSNEVFLLAAMFARATHERRSIDYLDQGYSDLAEVHNDLAFLASVFETEIELGVPGNVVLDQERY